MIEISAMLPHAPPMRLLTQLVAHDARSVSCRAEFVSSCPFADPSGAVDPLICVELVAQGAALLAALGAGADGEPVPGVIASCRSAHFHERPLRVGDTVRVKVTRVAGDDSFGSFEGQVFLQADEVATISLGVMLGAKPPLADGETS